MFPRFVVGELTTLVVTHKRASSNPMARRRPRVRARGKRNINLYILFCHFSTHSTVIVGATTYPTSLYASFSPGWSSSNTQHDGIIERNFSGAAWSFKFKNFMRNYDSPSGERWGSRHSGHLLGLAKVTYLQVSFNFRWSAFSSRERAISLRRHHMIERK